MRRSIALLQTVAALALLLPARLALAEPAVATTDVERRIEAADPPAEAEVMQVVLDFAPGAWTAVHRHGGPSYNTVLEGEITLLVEGIERTFAAGDGWVDEPGLLHAAGNQGTTAARLVASFVVPAGVAPSTVVEPEDRDAAPPEPSVVAFAGLEAPDLARPMDVVQRLIELAPGASVPMHAHPGVSLVGVLEGDLWVESGGTTSSFAAGDGWEEPAKGTHRYTAGDAPTRLVLTTFVPRGAPLGSPAHEVAESRCGRPSATFVQE
jgi:quercetin dioxygenase-like cupin family protein